jgi:hypothetical protein
MLKPNIYNPNMSWKRMIEIRDNFSDYVNGDLAIPEKYLKTDPDRKYAIGDPIYEMYNAYKLGPKSIDPKILTPEKNKMIENGKLEILKVPSLDSKKKDISNFYIY